MGPRIIFTEDDLAEMVEAYLEFDEFVFDTETVGTITRVVNDKDKAALDPLTNKVIWLSFAGPGRADVIPIGHPHGRLLVRKHTEKYKVPDPKGSVYLRDNPKAGIKAGDIKPITRSRVVDDQFGPPPKQLTPAQVFAALEPLFFSDRRKIGHNLKFDLQTIAKYYDWRMPPGPYGDTVVVQHLLNENLYSFQLEQILHKRYGIEYEQLGAKGVQNFSINKAAVYAIKDSRYTWWLWNDLFPKLEEQNLMGVFRFEMDVLKVLLPMEKQGVNIDRKRLEELGEVLEEDMERCKAQLFREAGKPWDVDAAAAKGWFIYEHLGFEPTEFTKKTHKPSTTAAAIEKFRYKHKMIKVLLHYSDIKKLHSTYVVSLLQHLSDNDKLHANFKQAGTKTGRFSCVSGNTEIMTSRGLFRIEDYVPQQGDLVPTSSGRWMPVARKVKVGKEEVFRVCLANGAFIECTANHRLRTPHGWRRVRDLTPGKKVFHVSVEALLQQPTEHPHRSQGVSSGGQADRRYLGRAVGYDPAEHSLHPGGEPRQGSVQGREGSALLTVQADGEPNGWQEWFTAPQLQGRDQDQGRLPAGQGAGALRVGAQADDGRRSWPQALASPMGGASHQRGEGRQPARQLCFGDKSWASSAARQEVAVARVEPLGAVEVWDLSVVEDQSYWSQGFLSHNCSDPNLQNIPRVTGDPDDRGALIRTMFVAPPGYKLIVADYDQIELRVLAHFSKDPVLLKVFNEGLDPHAMTAAMVLGIDIEEVTKDERQKYGKTINFASVYGAGARRLGEQIGCSKGKAQKFLDKYQEEYAGVYDFSRQAVKVCRQRKPHYVKTLMGRRRRVPDIMHPDNMVRWRAERQTVNSIIQGSAADLIKLAMVRLDDLLTDSPAQLVLSVHDELITLVSDEYVDETIELMEEAMMIDALRVPLTVEAKAGQSWAEAK